jgi:hypothetical protein
MFSAPFPLSGLADEAADDIDGQIAAHKALGWTALELRLLNGNRRGSRHRLFIFWLAANTATQDGIELIEDDTGQNS